MKIKLHHNILHTMTHIDKNLMYFMMFLDKFNIKSKETMKKLDKKQLVEDLFNKVLNYGGPSNTNEYTLDKKFSFIETFTKRKNTSIPELLQTFYILENKNFTVSFNNLKI